ICASVSTVVDSTEDTSMGLMPVPTTVTAPSVVASAATKSTFDVVPTLIGTSRGSSPFRLIRYCPVGTCAKRYVPSGPTVTVREYPDAGLVSVMVSPATARPFTAPAVFVCAWTPDAKHRPRATANALRLIRAANGLLAISCYPQGTWRGWVPFGERRTHVYPRSMKGQSRNR